PVSAKGEAQLTPEEKLLRAIFGENASAVKDTPLRVSSGVKGTVIDVQVFTRDGVEKDERAKQIEQEALEKFRKDLKDEYRILEQDILDRLRSVMTGKKVNGGAGLKRGTQLTSEILDELDAEKWFELRPADEDVAEQLERAHQYLEQHKKEQDERYKDKQ